MGYYEVLRLPLATFWSFNRQVDRLRAESEQRQIMAYLAGSPDAAEMRTKALEALKREIGVTVLFERGFDDAKFEELQKKFSKGSVKGNTHTE